MYAVYVNEVKYLTFETYEQAESFVVNSATGYQYEIKKEH